MSYLVSAWVNEYALDNNILVMTMNISMLYSTNSTKFAKIIMS